LIVSGLPAGVERGARGQKTSVPGGICRPERRPATSFAPKARPWDLVPPGNCPLTAPYAVFYTVAQQTALAKRAMGGASV
jgi:hypothetical protein